MPALTLAVILVALPDSLNPTLIVAAIYLTLGPTPVRSTLAFTISAFAVTLAAGLAIALGVGDLILSVLPKVSPATKWKLITAAGVVVACFGVVIWWRRRSLADTEPPSHRPPAQHSGSPVTLGAGIAGLEVLTAFPYFAAIAMVIGSSVSLGAKAFLLVLYNVIYVLPLIAIVVVCAVMGRRRERVLTPVGDWIATRWPVVVSPIAVLAGVGLAVYGIMHLR